VRVVLDAEAVNALLDPRHSAERTVRRAMDALLSRESSDALLIRDTDRRLARLVGGLLAQAHAGSALLADAHPVAVAAWKPVSGLCKIALAAETGVLRGHVVTQNLTFVARKA
jgi:hypothetical protein